LKAILKVVKQGWTGWSPEQPKAEETTAEVEKGSVLDSVKGISNPSAVIKDINNDTILLSTTGLAPRKEGSGINLKGNFSGLETVLKKGESTKFTTQTMDAGVNFTISLVEIKP
jgi:hypothetical protein